MISAVDNIVSKSLELQTVLMGKFIVTKGPTIPLQKFSGGGAFLYGTQMQNLIVKCGNGCVVCTYRVLHYPKVILGNFVVLLYLFKTA